VLIRDSRLKIVNALDVRQTGTNASIGQPAVLTDASRLDAGRKIGVGIPARIVVELILPYETAERQHCAGTEHTGPCGRDVERSDFRALVLRSNRQSVGAQASVVHY